MTKIFLSIIVCAFAIASPLRAQDAKPINVLIITGDHGHDWKKTTPFIKDFLTKAGMKVEVTETPSKDLISENLGKYDVLLLNYKDTPGGKPESRWADENTKAFAEAVKSGKGLVVYHHASSAFIDGSDWSKQFEEITAGGWRKQGFHGARHVYDVKMFKADHPITKDMPEKFTHAKDELYQNSLITSGSEVLVAAISDKSKDPKNTGKDEPMVWINKYGEGRVVQNALGHDLEAMDCIGFQTLLIRCVEFAATGDAKHPVPADLKAGK